MLIPLLSLFLLMLAFICKQDKKAFWILWVFMAIIMCCNTYNNDWDAYEYMYSLIDSIDNIALTDVGYGFLNFVANKYVGLEFWEFRAIFTFVGMLILRRIITEYSPYPALVLGLFFIAPFFPNDIIQIRNFMSQVIFLYFVTKWIESKNRSVIWYLLGVALAITMHSSAVYFVAFLLLCIVKNDKKLYIGVFFATLFVGVLPRILGLIPFISIHKITHYLGAINQGIDIRGVIIVFLIIMQTYILYYIWQYSEKTENLRLRKWANIVYKMNILCLPVCAVMLVWSFNFYRIPRNMLLLNYIVYSMYLKEKKEKKIIDLLLVISIVQGVLWSAINSFSQWSVIWNNNALFKW